MRVAFSAVFLSEDSSYLAFQHNLTRSTSADPPPLETSSAFTYLKLREVFQSNIFAIGGRQSAQDMHLLYNRLRVARYGGVVRINLGWPFY